jgi:hypothetical protein
MEKKEQEVFKEIPIEGLNGMFDVSNYGRVRRVFVTKNLEVRFRYPMPQPTKDGYLRVNAIRNGKHYNLSIHKAVALTFIGPCPSGKEVNHKDFDRAHNYRGNLEYKKHGSNIRYSFRAGMYDRKGSKNNRAVLTEDEVTYIRRKCSEDNSSLHKMARKFKVSKSTIGRVISHKTWTHV